MGKEAKRVKAGSAEAQRLEERIKFVQEYIKLWRQFFEMFADGFEGRKILRRDEEEFARIVNSLAHHHYRFSAMVYQEMGSADDVLKVLCETVSLSHLKGLSEAQLSKIQVDWHTIFIQMNKALGRLIARRPLPEEQRRGKAARRRSEPAATAPEPREKSP